MFEVYQEVGWLRAAEEDEKNIINLRAPLMDAAANTSHTQHS